MSAKPRIKDSKRHLRCEKLKYWCLWGPFLALVLAGMVCNIVLARAVNRFGEKWLTFLWESDPTLKVCTIMPY